MEGQKQWFAARLISGRSYASRYLECNGIETAVVADVPTLRFIHCDVRTIKALKIELYGHLMIYRKAGSMEPDPVPDDVMRSFLIMSPHHEEPVLFLSVNDPGIFKGTAKRVTKGIFAGCIGVIKRIKGDRRLIVKVSETAAIATPYIPQDFLEDVEGGSVEIMELKDRK